jgi:hypothetical protein
VKLFSLHCPLLSLGISDFGDDHRLACRQGVCGGFLECPGGVDVDTVKAVVLVAVPTDVVTLRGPVDAPEGTEV